MKANLDLPKREAFPTDRILGGGLLAFSVVVFVYYSIWVLVTPFIPEDSKISFVLKFFLPRYYAIAIPLALLAVLVSIVGIFAGWVMIRTASRNKKKTS
mmetsp:Transcript_22086/g.36573  ORF Transcript_22086/g.36573 Transcript_22086/m.36573 type:complete len:99 (+) Transcript_22086:101-397(+)